MRDIIHIRPDDFFWRFYCRRFTIEGKQIEAPRNLCRYFWTSVQGFGLWLGREVRLRKLWGLWLVLTVALLGLYMPNIANPFMSIVESITAVLWLVAFHLAMYISLIRVMRVGKVRLAPTARAIHARAPWLLPSLFIALAATILFLQADPWAVVQSIIADVFKDFPRLLGYAALMVAAVGVVASIVSKIPVQRLQKVKRAFQTVVAVLSAKKRRVCPPVIPPEGFEVKE